MGRRPSAARLPAWCLWIRSTARSGTSRSTSIRAPFSTSFSRVRTRKSAAPQRGPVARQPSRSTRPAKYTPIIGTANVSAFSTSNCHCRGLNKSAPTHLSSIPRPFSRVDYRKELQGLDSAIFCRTVARFERERLLIKVLRAPAGSRRLQSFLLATPRGVEVVRAFADSVATLSRTRLIPVGPSADRVPDEENPVSYHLRTGGSICFVAHSRYS